MLAVGRTPFKQLRDCGPGVWLAPCPDTQLEQSVRLFGTRSQKSARPVIFERSADESHARGEQGGGERVTSKARVAPVIKLERQGPGSINQSAIVESVRSTCCAQ